MKERSARPLSERVDADATSADQPLEAAIFSRIGRALYMVEGESSDVARLGHHLAGLNTPVAFASIARTFRWSVDRLEQAILDLSLSLPNLGMALFEYADELIAIGPLPASEENQDHWSSRAAVERDSSAVRGISPEGAAILRNLLDNSISVVEASPFARQIIGSLLNMGFVHESGTRILLADAVRSTYDAGQLPSRSAPVK